MVIQQRCWRNGKVLLAGGYFLNVSKTAEIFDPATEKFTGIGSMYSDDALSSAHIIDLAGSAIDYQLLYATD